MYGDRTADGFIVNCRFFSHRKSPQRNSKKKLAEDITIYAFYGHPAEIPRRLCDENDITIHSIGIELTLPSKYEDFEDIFSKKECETIPESTRVTYTINLKKDTESLFRLIYSLSERELRILRDYLTEKKTIDWIRRLKSPAGTPILFIPKPDNSLQLYVDYRALNKITTKNRHPLPLINKLIDRLLDIRVYIKLDLRDAYYRIHIKKRDEWKTAFRTRYGLWEYIIIFFRLTNAPATFQAYINKTLDGLLDTILWWVGKRSQNARLSGRTKQQQHDLKSLIRSFLCV